MVAGENHDENLRPGKVVKRILVAVDTRQFEIRRGGADRQRLDVDFGPEGGARSEHQADYQQKVFHTKIILFAHPLEGRM